MSLYILQYTNARNFLWDKLSVAKLLHHGMHVYLSISCQIIQNGCTQSTPHEAFRQAASLATLSIIQFSHFCQFNIVNGTWISLITIFNMPSRTWLWELFFFFFSFVWVLLSCLFIFFTCLPMTETDLPIYRNSQLIIHSFVVLSIENASSHLVTY